MDQHGERVVDVDELAGGLEDPVRDLPDRLL